MEIQQNTGVKVMPPKSSDWFFGGETGIVFENRIGYDSWGNYLPVDELQQKQFQTMACVSFSALNCLETQLDWMIFHNKLSPEISKKCVDLGYLDPNVMKFRFSDRFTAKMSGTTQAGNWMSNVWDSIRHDGLIPENDWPFDNNMTWNDYYAEVPQALKDKAKEFLKLFEVTYEIVPNDYQSLIHNLMQAPLQITLGTCSPWCGNSNAINPCARTDSNHAVLLYGYDDMWKIFDTCSPFDKILASNYPINFAFKGLIAVKQPVSVPTVNNYVLLTNVSYGMTKNGVVSVLQDALKQLGLFPLTVQSTGNYFSITADAVKKFQIKYAVLSLDDANALAGKSFGPKSRAALNSLLNK